MARCNITPESLPIEYNITGLRNSAATSRMMPMDSASRRFRFSDNGIRRSGWIERWRNQRPTCDEIRIAEGGFPVKQGRAAGTPDTAASSTEDRLAGVRIPLHRAAKAWI